MRRLRLGWWYSQEDFAFRVDSHQTYVSSVERDEKNATIGTADRIVRALDTTLSRMFSELERNPDRSDGGWPNA